MEAVERLFKIYEVCVNGAVTFICLFDDLSEGEDVINSAFPFLKPACSLWMMFSVVPGR